MRNVIMPKGVADIRTAINAHIRSSSPHEGTPYLDMMVRGAEKRRLRKELALLARRQDWIQKRLAEINQVMESRLSQVQEEDQPVSDPPTPNSPTPRSLEKPASRNTPWRTVTVEY